MTGNDLKTLVIYAAFVVPTDSLEGWKELSFNKIPKNSVSISSEQKLKVEVNQSASPLVYKLPKTIKTTSIEFNYDFVSQVKPSASNTKVPSFPEDFILRVGLVAQGQKTLGWFQKKIAASWVLELFSLAPKDVGLDKIYFFNIASNKDLVGSSRIHPKSELMLEEIIGSYPENKKINFVLKEPLEVVAIWLSIDGDDQKSSFITEISDLKLHY